MSTKQIVAINTVSQIVGKIITGSTTFFISIFLAKSLSTSGYGDFTKITTYVAVFYLFADFGLNAAYVQESEKNASLAQILYSSLFTIRILMAFMLIIISLLVLFMLPGSTNSGYTGAVRYGILLFCPTILFQSLITTTNALFQKHLRYDLSAVALSVGSLVSILAVLFSINAYSSSFGLYTGLLALLTGSFVTVVMSFVLQRKESPLPSFTFHRKPLRMLFRVALPLGITLLFNVVYFRADSIILTILRSTDDVGLYGFAYKLFEFPLVFPTFFMNALFPLLLMSWEKNNRKKFIRLIKLSMVMLMFSGVCISVIGWFFAPYISLVRSEFIPSIEILRVLLYGLPIYFLTALSMWILVTMEKRRALLFIYGGGMIGNIVLNVLYIPMYGPIGAAWITVVSESVVLLLSYCVIIVTLLSKEQLH